MLKEQDERVRIPDPCLEVSLALSSLFVHKRRQVVQPPLWVRIPFFLYPGTLNRRPAEMGQRRDRFWAGYVVFVWAVGQQIPLFLEDTLKKVRATFSFPGACKMHQSLWWALFPSLRYRRSLPTLWNVRRNLLGSLLPCCISQLLYSNTA